MLLGISLKGTPMSSNEHAPASSSVFAAVVTIVIGHYSLLVVLLVVAFRKILFPNTKAQ